MTEIAVPARARRVGRGLAGDGRTVVALILALFTVALGLHNWKWSDLAVPAGHGFPFEDTRGITSAWECARKGIAVLPTNPCDLQHRPQNYPRIWMAPSVLPLGTGSTVYFGAAAVLVFLFAVFLFVGRIQPGDSLVYGAALCSPAVMLGIERGNADLPVFAVVVAALALFRAARPAHRAIAHALFLFAAVLKLYPLFAWGVLHRQRPRWALAGSTAVVFLFGVYALATLSDIRTIERVSTQEILYSYGAGVLSDGAFFAAGRNRVASAVTSVIGTNRSTAHLAVVGIGLALGVLITVASLAWRRRRPQRYSEDSDPRELDGFWVGAGLYVGTYALLHNFNYKLIFLLLTIPQLLTWSRNRRASVPLPSVGLALVLLSMWLGTSIPFFPYGLTGWTKATETFPHDEFVNLALFAYLTAALALTVPVPRRLHALVGYSNES